MANETAVTIGTTATLIGTCPFGGALTIQNTGSTEVFVGTDASVTTSNGLALAAASGGTPGGSLFRDYKNSPQGPDTWYGIVASSTGTVVFLPQVG